MLFKGKGSAEELGEPVIRASICTGERVIGFRKEGKLTKGEIVRSDKDIEAFCKKYKIDKSSVKTVY
ncbi:MAG: aspartate dehydrogenase [Clostridiales bacterium]|nr:aspartate dehydrogenase [Clostridiales bacterium]MCD8214736.1 aspartate dehydrogenase [Clostridiales bacterium]